MVRKSFVVQLLLFVDALMTMNRFFFCLVACLFSLTIQAQQLPDFTQYPAHFFAINPAYTGTKGHLDARINYRRQWVGFDGAPTTQTIAVHSRLLKGMIGVGGVMYKDVTGPIQRFNYSFTAAYHLRFPDVEFSAGIGYNRAKTTFNTANSTTHYADAAVPVASSNFDKTNNVAAGLLLYNDRFHFGLGMMQIINNKAELFIQDTTQANIPWENHFYFTTGYNFHGHPDYVWENNVMFLYVIGLPMTINYNLRVHYKEKITAGVAWRMRDAVALQAGLVFLDNFQAIYSYDVGISRLRKGHSGTHEIMLGYRLNIGGSKGGYKGFQDFQRQRYHLF
jgi:type IX secretion system PorP/SprF family membrane protein